MNPPNPTSPHPATDAHSFWADLRAALRGTNADYTRIPLKRAVFLLAIPMMLELVLESTFAVVDIFFVAKLGASAIATVGLTETYLFLLIQIPLAWTLALPMGWAHSGVFWGVFVSETAVGLFTLWLFSRGRWKTVKV